MRLDIEKVLVASLYADNRLYKIPRYQRDYSWGKKETSQMFEDIFNTMIVTSEVLSEGSDKIAFEKTGENIRIDDYLLGNILLSGEIKNSRQGVLEIIDGQQRITSIMIFYSAFLEHFREANELSKYRDDIEHVIKEIEGLFYRGRAPKKMGLTKETTSDFFDNFIYKSIVSKEINSSEISYIANKENQCIKEAYQNFYEKLSEKFLEKRKLNKFSHEYLLLKLYDQLQNATLVLISSTDSKIVNTIFESYNSKGKSLDPIDLIKNNVFQVLSEYPHEEAKPKWTLVKNNLLVNRTKTRSDELEIISTVNLDHFFMHFWNANYKNVTERYLYESFLQEMKKLINVKNSEEKVYKCLLSEMIEYSEIYGHIVNSSSMNIFSNENKNEVEVLLSFLNKINIVQVRVVLMQLMYGVKCKLINEKNFLKLLRNIVFFHYMFSTVGSIRANKFANSYKTFALNLKESFSKGSKNEIDKIQKAFVKNLNNLIVENKSTIKENLTDMNLSYSNEIPEKNMTKKQKKEYYVTKFFLYYIAYQRTGQYIPNMTIEHLYPASDNTQEKRFMFGNLSMLEKILNSECDDKILTDKIEIYIKSSNTDIKEVTEDFDITQRQSKLITYILSQKLKQ